MNDLSFKIVKLLTEKKLTVSFAESCTGGLLASTITSISGSSKVFNMGLVTYSNNAKMKLLKVPKRTITKHGAVSHETCQTMVQNLSKISKSNISISITGVAGPNGGTKEKPVGLVFIGVKQGSKIIVKRKFFKSKKRVLIQKNTVNEVLKIIKSIIS